VAQPSNRSALLDAALRRHPELDPQAVRRVAGVEGLSGGIGDGGHAFGPFQLNNAGGVITGRFKGMSPEQINAWAWSPQGIEYALQGISKVAGGQHGSQAVNSIVRRFERPADPNGEVQRALGGSMQSVPAGASSSSATVGGPTAATGAPDSRRLFAQQLLAAISPTGQLDNAGLMGALQTRQQSLTVPASFAPAAAPTGAAPTQGGGKGILELLREGVGGPTHSTGPHIHAAFGNPQLEIAAINWAQAHGLHVGENPYVGDTVDPVHAPNSYHTRDFPGRYHGRKLGMAIDVSGGNTDAFYNWLNGRR
jgi:hypothetical protein